MYELRFNTPDKDEKISTKKSLAKIAQNLLKGKWIFHMTYNQLYYQLVQQKTTGWVTIAFKEWRTIQIRRKQD